MSMLPCALLCAISGVSSWSAGCRPRRPSEQAGPKSRAPSPGSAAWALGDGDEIDPLAFKADRSQRPRGVGAGVDGDAAMVGIGAVDRRMAVDDAVTEAALGGDEGRARPIEGVIGLILERARRVDAGVDEGVVAEFDVALEPVEKIKMG